MTKDMYETMRTHANLKSSWRNARLQCTCHRARTHCRRCAHCIVSGLSHAHPGFHMCIRAFICASGLSHVHPGFPGSIDRVVSGQLDLLAKYGWRPIEMRLEPEVAMSLSTKRLHAGNAVLRSPWVRGPLVVLLARSVLAASLRRWIGRHEVQAGLPHARRRMRPDRSRPVSDGAGETQRALPRLLLLFCVSVVVVRCCSQKAKSVVAPPAATDCCVHLS